MTVETLSGAPSADTSSPPTDERTELIGDFTGLNGSYYAEQFEKIGSTTQFTWTFNIAAALLGPI